MSIVNKTILIIEDDEFLSKILAEKFESEGFTTHKANDGQEGYNLAIEIKPAMILLDLILPKMDGISVLKRLRKDDWGKTANVIILSNLFRAELDGEAISQHVAAYLLKTEWNPDQIVEKVNEVLKTK